jgi:hypothetical protein
VKTPKKNVLAQLILEKHNNSKQKFITSILDGIIDNVCNKEPDCNKPKQCFAGIAVFGDVMNKILKQVPCSLIDSIQWFHANCIKIFAIQKLFYCNL